jgi:hypothetical protein
MLIILTGYSMKKDYYPIKLSPLGFPILFLNLLVNLAKYKLIAS